jgi:hypothetical protein
MLSALMNQSPLMNVKLKQGYSPRCRSDLDYFGGGLVFRLTPLWLWNSPRNPLHTQGPYAA